VWGMAQLYGFQPSQHNLFLLTGSFFNPGPYAGYLAMLSPLALFYVVSDYWIWSKPYHTKYSLFYLRWIVAAITLLATVLVLRASMSRAAWLASAGGCFFVSFAYLASQFKLKFYIIRYKKTLPVVVVVMVLLLSGGGFAMYKMKKDSADGRTLIWKNTLSAIKEQPFGVGLGHFAEAYGKAQVSYFETETATEQEETVAGNPEYAFNEYLQLGLETGILGLLLFVVAVIMLIKKGIKQQKYETVGAVVSLLVFATMSYPFSVLPFLIVFVYLLADLAEGNETANPNHQNRSIALYSINGYVLLTFNFIALAFCLYNRYPTYNAYKEWNSAKMLFTMQLYADAAPEYARLAPYLSDRVEFLFEYGQILSKTAHYQKSNEVLAVATSLSCDPMLYNVMGKNHQALKNYKAAEQNFQMAANIVPSRIYPYYLLAKLHTQTGDNQKFEQAASMVLQKEPKIHSPAIEEMRAEIKALLKTEK
jgi:O-antigen ligase